MYGEIWREYREDVWSFRDIIEEDKMICSAAAPDLSALVVAAVLRGATAPPIHGIVAIEVAVVLLMSEVRPLALGLVIAAAPVEDVFPGSHARHRTVPSILVGARLHPLLYHGVLMRDVCTEP